MMLPEEATGSNGQAEGIFQLWEGLGPALLHPQAPPAACLLLAWARLPDPSFPSRSLDRLQAWWGAAGG